MYGRKKSLRKDRQETEFTRGAALEATGDHRPLLSSQSAAAPARVAIGAELASTAPSLPWPVTRGPAVSRAMPRDCGSGGGGFTVLHEPHSA